MAERARLASLALAALLWSVPAAATSPWMPAQGELDASSLTIYEVFDHFYMGGNKTKFPVDFEQITQAFNFEYGLFDDVSLDFTTGYVRVFGDLPTNDGLMDTTFGLKLRLVDEFAFDEVWVPTVSMRFGGIVKGTYQASGQVFPGIPGDKASGLESELAIGKTLPYGFALAGNLGVRAREKDVPIEWHLRTAAYYSPIDEVTLSIAYDQWRATSGIDIGDPGFAQDFRNLKEITKDVEAGLTVSDPKQHFFLTGYYTRTVGGRNTGVKDVGGFTITIPIQVYRP